METNTFGKRRRNTEGVALIIDSYGTEIIIPLLCGYCSPMYSRTKRRLEQLGYDPRPGVWSNSDIIIGEARIHDYKGYIRQ